MTFGRAQSREEFLGEFLILLVGLLDLRRGPSDEELADPAFDLSAWLSGFGVSESQMHAALCRRARIPFVPGTLLPHRAPIDFAKLQSIGIGARTPNPWLIIDAVDWKPVVAHFAPNCTDFQGFEPGNVFRVLISVRDYQRRLAEVPPVLAATDSRPPTFDEYRTTVAPLCQSMYGLEGGEQFPAAEILRVLSTQHMNFIPLSRLTRVPESVAKAVGAPTEELFQRYDALCYSLQRNHYFAVAPTGTEGPLQDQLRQLATEAGDRKWVTLAWAPKDFVRLRMSVVSMDSIMEAFDTQLKAGELVITHTVEGIRAEQAAAGDPKALLQWLFLRAVQENASDLHLEADGETHGIVRARVDGDLVELVRIPLATLSAITSLIKQACRLPLGTKNRILDGNFTTRPPRGVAVECRVSIIPQPNQEATVIRLAIRSVTNFDTVALGMRPMHNFLFREAMKNNRGLIVITGPTGCGKSTTLYTLLNENKSKRINTITIENPIEVKQGGIRQFATVEDQEFGFAQVFRGCLRQDPDVIMVGEMRDRESAEIAVRAALTGHLVLTTLHTRDALGVVFQLFSLGIDPAQLAEALVVLQAQRLATRLCPGCSEEYTLTSREEAVLKRECIAIPPNFRPRRQSPTGCSKCRERGTIGQQVVMEAFPVTRQLGDLIRARAAYSAMADYVRERKWPTLFHDALKLYARNIISFEEALLHTADFDPPFIEVQDVVPVA